MPLVSKAPTFATARVSAYVPNMQYAADVQIDGATKISFGSPAAASATAILNAQSIASATTVYTFGGAASAGPYQLDGTYGRAITLVLSGAGTPTVTVNGRDYLGQRITETMTGNGTTAVNSAKCYKWIDSIGFTAVGATTMNVGTLAVFGLPYKATKVLAEELADVPQGTLGTLTNPVLTDPATATTGEPRGKYAPNATPNGTELTATFLFSSWANASGNGGLHGIRHYSA